MKDKIRNFFKQTFDIKNNFIEWKMEQLARTETLFVYMLAIMHGVYIFAEIGNLLRREVLPEYYEFVFVSILRLLPIVTVTVNYILYKKKLISIYVYNYINNFVMLFVVVATGVSKYFVPKPDNPLGSILIDCIISIMATIFMPAIFSIFNFIICLTTIVLMGIFLPETAGVVKDTIMSLVPFGIGMVIFVFSIDQNFRKMHKYIGKIKTMSVEDSLTGLYNRNILKEKVYDKHSERCSCSGCMLMLDIDHFKDVNDTYGHQTGDDLLCRLSEILIQNVRKEDWTVRFGGEEFLIIFNELSLNDAVTISERIRTQVENCECVPKFTVSCGVAPFSSGNRFESVIKKVDDKLYEAKKSGRNRTCS